MFTKREYNWVWFALIFIIWLVSLLLINVFVDENNKGTFGDQFGAVNALFTGLSLAGIIITLRQQQEELSDQRREFMTSRATNQLYQQVNLINNAFINLTYYEYLKNAEPGQKYQNFQGNAAFNSIISDFEKIKKSEVDKNLTIEKIVAQTGQLLRITANSVKILKRLREIENMTDTDAQLLYETFYYNIDSRIWDFVHNLNLINKNEIEPLLVDEYKFEEKSILEFKSEFTKLSKLMN